MSVIRFVDPEFLENHLRGASSLRPEDRQPNIGLFEQLGPSGFSLNALLIDRPAATFLMRVQGNGWTACGLQDEDLLIVDRSVTPKAGSLVIAPVDGALEVGRLTMEQGRWVLWTPHSPGSSDKPVWQKIQGESLEIWGVIIRLIHQL
jgi:DNA polymerase V